MPIASFWLIMGSLWMTPLSLELKTTQLSLSGPIPSSEVGKEVSFNRMPNKKTNDHFVSLMNTEETLLLMMSPPPNQALGL